MNDVLPPEIADIPVEAPVDGIQRGDDGYFSFQVNTPISSESSSGESTALLKLNDLPESFSVDNVNTLKLSLFNGTDEISIFPTRGFIVNMEVITAEIAGDVMLFTLLPKRIEFIKVFHSDTVEFMQIKVSRDHATFLSHKPGTIFNLVVDFPVQDNQ